MEWSCRQLTAHYGTARQWPAANFNLKDMLVLYAALRSKAPAAQCRSWREQLRAPTPERLYFGGHNWVFYGTAAETLRIRLGLSDRRDWIDAALAAEMPNWTGYGMYRDPGDPVTYDLTVRQSLAMMLENGYAGAHVTWLRQTLRTGALATLLFASPTGVAPCGGRSNQYHMMEAMTAYLAEWQAKAEAAAGDAALAGALRRLALAGAEAVRRWLLQDPYLCQKNQMPLPRACRAVALGVGWPQGADWRYLAAAGRTTHEVDVDTAEEPAAVRCTVRYRDRDGALGTPLVEERYELSERGLCGRYHVPNAPRLRLQVPFIETDGALRSEFTCDGGEAVVRYAGHACRVSVPESAASWVEPWRAPNRNGLYRVAVFETAGPRLTCRAVLDP